MKDSPLPLILTICVVLCAFAGNSILSRLGVFHYGMDPLAFAALRVLSGAVALVALVRLRGGALNLWSIPRWGGALALTLYLFGFSWAYLTLDAGLGALILFGVVQLVMFGWASARGQGTTTLGWLGALVALGGLALLLWPSGDFQVSASGALAMIAAGVGWGIYSLLGKSETDPLAATAGNFVLSTPLVLIGMLALTGWSWTWGGIVTAMISGAVTSGFGYALWYQVLARITPTAAAVLQLSVPVLAVAGGVILLREPLTSTLVVATALVLSGIGLSLIKGR